MTTPDQDLRARIEDHLQTILVDVNPLTGEEDEDLGYQQLLQALPRLAGRLVHASQVTSSTPGLSGSWLSRTSSSGRRSSRSR
jgi:hypothetical protein